MGMNSRGVSRRVKVGAALVVVGAGAWGLVEVARPDDETFMPSPDPGTELSRAEIGRPYAATLYTHCGIESYAFDGSLWLADPPLNDTQGNPPPGWGNPRAEGTFTLSDRDQAVFRADNGKTAHFRRVPKGQEPETPPCR